MEARPGNAQAPDRPLGHQPRLTGMAPNGGCSGKIGPGDLEALLALAFTPAGAGGSAGAEPDSPLGELVWGLETGDDAVIVRIRPGCALVVTTDFFPPVVDDAYDWGRVAAANALSDVYAMGGEPVTALNLLKWPTDRLPGELAARVLQGGQAVLAEAGCLNGGGHSLKDDTPTYGLAVTGLVDPDRLLRNDRARPGDPISLTKPLGLGVLNNRHKATGECFPEAVETMVRLNRDAARAALATGVVAATDVTGFGLLGHLYKMCRASGVGAVVEAAAVPYLDGARQSLQAGFVPGGTRRNLEWVAPHLQSRLGQEELLLLADAQTSGGLLVAGEVPGGVVIGCFTGEGPATVHVV